MKLKGQRVAVTRPASGNDLLAELLRRHGADVVTIPLIRTAPPADSGPLRRAARRLAEYDWIVFTSAAGVNALLDVLPRAAGPVTARVAAVGSVTAAAVEQLLGWPVSAVPAQFSGAGLCEAMAAVAPVAGAAVFWPRARDARPELRLALQAAGATLHAPEAYRTEPLPAAAASLREAAESGVLTVITLTSPSAADALAAAGPIAASVVIAVIGPSTGQAARRHGMTVSVQAEEHTAAGLVRSLIRYLDDTASPEG
jgi:uroporphyrinogen-III synthase